MKRQALIIKPIELIDLFLKLTEEVDIHQNCQINIINKDGTSDGWEIEK